MTLTDEKTLWKWREIRNSDHSRDCVYSECALRLAKWAYEKGQTSTPTGVETHLEPAGSKVRAISEEIARAEQRGRESTTILPVCRCGVPLTFRGYMKADGTTTLEIDVEHKCGITQNAYEKGRASALDEVEKELASDDTIEAIARNLLALFYHEVPEESGEYTLGQKIQARKYATSTIFAFKKSAIAAARRKSP